MLTFYPSRIPDPGVKKQHRIPDPDPQHWQNNKCQPVFNLTTTLFLNKRHWPKLSAWKMSLLVINCFSFKTLKEFNKMECVPHVKLFQNDRFSRMFILIIRYSKRNWKLPSLSPCRSPHRRERSWWWRWQLGHHRPQDPRYRSQEARWLGLAIVESSAADPDPIN